MRRGYTLVELLIVIAGFSVIGLIAAGVYATIHFIIKFW